MSRWGFLAAVVAAFTVAISAAVATAAPPGDQCGTITGPRWTAPGHRSGRLWDVAEFGTSCGAAKFVVERVLREPVHRGQMKAPSPFISCSVDVRHRNIHPFAAGACSGDKVAVSWGIHY